MQEVYLVHSCHLACLNMVLGVIWCGMMQEMGPVEPWNGSVTTWFNREIGDWNSNGYGAWLHAANPHIGSFSTSSGWTSGADFKRRLLDYPQTCCLAVFIRDTSEGRVYLSEDGLPCIAYQYNDYDRRTMIEVPCSLALSQQGKTPCKRVAEVRSQRQLRLE